MNDRGMTFSNSSVMNNTCGPIDTSVHPFFIAVYSLIFVVGSLLNSFTMNFYFCRAQQQVSSSCMIYLKNLTAADFLLCLCLLLRVSNYTSSSVIIGQLYCSFGSSFFFLNMYASILFMGYIAANRYLKIIHPSGTHILQRVRAARIISTVTWVCLLGLTIIFIILFFITQESKAVKPNRCVFLLSEHVILLIKIIHSGCAIAFLLVLISLVFFYYSISRKVLLLQQIQLASSGSKKLVKSRRNMLVLVSIFCVCFVPTHLVRIPFTLLLNNCSVGHVLYYAMDAATTMSALNVCLDPLVYFFLCKAFRARVNLRMSFMKSRINIQQANRKSEISDEEQEATGNHHISRKESDL